MKETMEKDMADLTAKEEAAKVSFGEMVVDQRDGRGEGLEGAVGAGA